MFATKILDLSYFGLLEKNFCRERAFTSLCSAMFLWSGGGKKNKGTLNRVGLSKCYD